MAIRLSVVIPAYNEVRRLPPYLAAIRNHLASALPGGYEVIVVDDGSRDGTARVLRGSFGDWPPLRVEVHNHNRGKGAAVRTGVLAARGELVLFADADGATPIAEERKLRSAIEEGADIAVGSRLLTMRAVPVIRTCCRDIAGRLFAHLVHASFRLPIRDVQCGFKMFRREVGQGLFQSCRAHGYDFDVAILYAAHRLGCRMAEVPIRWTEMPGSKFHLIADTWRVASGLSTLRVSSLHSDEHRWLRQEPPRLRN